MAQAAQVGQMAVADAGLRQRRGQRLAVELRVVARAGDGAHVGHQRHAVVAQQRDELLQRPGGVADGEDRLHRRAPALGRGWPRGCWRGVLVHSSCCLFSWSAPASGRQTTLQILGPEGTWLGDKLPGVGYLIPHVPQLPLPISPRAERASARRRCRGQPARRPPPAPTRRPDSWESPGLHGVPHIQDRRQHLPGRVHL